MKSRCEIFGPSDLSFMLLCKNRTNVVWRVVYNIRMSKLSARTMGGIQLYRWLGTITVYGRKCTVVGWSHYRTRPPNSWDQDFDCEDEEVLNYERRRDESV